MHSNIYRTLNLKTKELMVMEEEIMVALETLQGERVFSTRRSKFRAAEVRFASKKLDSKRARETIKQKDWYYATRIGILATE